VLFINILMLQHFIGYRVLCKTHMLFYIHICACLRAGFVMQLINSRSKCLSHSTTVRCQVFSTKLIKKQVCTSSFTVLLNSHINAFLLLVYSMGEGLLQPAE